MMEFDYRDDSTEILYERLLQHEVPYWEGRKISAAKARQGIPTGLMMHSQDANGNFHDHELYIPKHAITLICARSGGGKTTSMVGIATRLAMSGRTGLFITLEEPGHAIDAKLIASYSRMKNVSYSMQALTVSQAIDVVAGKAEDPIFDDFKREVGRRMRVVDANEHIDLSHATSPSVMYQPQYIADLIGYMNERNEKELDFVIIDFGQLMEVKDADNSQVSQRMKAVMQAMKNLCGQLGLAVIMGAQLQRSVSSVSVYDWEPEMIRDSSDIEQAASLIIAIGQDKEDKDKEFGTTIRYLKNRNGPKRVGGMFKIEFEHCYIHTKGGVPGDE